MSNEELAKIRGKKISLIFQGAINALNPVIKVVDQVVEAILTHEEIDKNEAKKRIEEKGILSPIGNNYYKDQVEGFIRDIENNILYVEVVSYEILSNPEMDVRKITVSNNTKIIKSEKKSDVEQAKAVEEYYLKHPEYKNKPFFLF